MTQQPRVRVIPVVKASPRRPLEALGAAFLFLAALPAGLAVTVVLRTRHVIAEEADLVGLAITAAFGAAAAIFAWHARNRIRRNPGVLRGLTTATIALYGGLCIVIACAVVFSKMLLP